MGISNGNFSHLDVWHYTHEYPSCHYRWTAIRLVLGFATTISEKAVQDESVSIAGLSHIEIGRNRGRQLPVFLPFRRHRSVMGARRQRLGSIDNSDAKCSIGAVSEVEFLEIDPLNDSEMIPG